MDGYDDANDMMHPHNGMPTGGMDGFDEEEIEYPDLDVDEDQLLDWDKPLREQPENVKKRLEELKFNTGPLEYAEVSVVGRYGDGRDVNDRMVFDRISDATFDDFLLIFAAAQPSISFLFTTLSWGSAFFVESGKYQKHTQK